MIQQFPFRVYTRRKQKHYFKKIYVCTPMFIAALFRIAKIWKQAKCPSTDEWMKKMWDIYKIEYYSAIKRMK